MQSLLDEIIQFEPMVKEAHKGPLRKLIYKLQVRLSARLVGETPRSCSCVDRVPRLAAGAAPLHRHPLTGACC